MPYINVHVDLCDLFEDVSDDDLLKEIRRRKIGKNYSIPEKQAKYTLEQAADIFRSMGRIDLAYRLDEIKVDFIEH